MAGSGGKVITVNLRERLYSSDSNRAQQFRSAELAEILNYLFVTETTDDFPNMGVPSFHNTTEAPLTAFVLNGFLFEPDIAAITGNITQGMVVMSDPDGAPDPSDSPIKVVHEPDAVASPTFTPNSSGSTRIDILECSRSVANTETAIRDIFDTSNGTFAPTNVTKVQKSTLSWRIRLGANGGGLPAANSGYMPIAIISSPTGATTWDDCTIWDVRPLAADLARAPFNANVDLPSQQRNTFALVKANGSSKLFPIGYCETSIGPWRAGGMFVHRNSTDLMDLESANFIEPGTTFGAFQMYTAFFVQPGGFPRWVQYTPAAYGSRVPRGPRGIPVLSNQIPNSVTTILPLGLTLPTGLGFTGTENSAMRLFAAGYCDGSGEPWELGTDGRMQLPAFGWEAAAVAPTARPTTTTLTFQLTAGTHFPGNARRLRLHIIANVGYTGTLPTHIDLQTLDDLTGGAAPTHNVTRRTVFTHRAANTFEFISFECEMPVEFSWPYEVGTTTRTFQLIGSGASPVFSASLGDHQVQVVGWDLGP